MNKMLILFIAALCVGASLLACNRIETVTPSKAESTEPASASSLKTTVQSTAAETSGMTISVTTAAPATSKATDTQATTAKETQAGTSSVTAAPEESDDTWALFLVNQEHPLAAEYSIETKTVYKSYMEFKMDTRMADQMIQMIADAKKDGINLTICSAYRSYVKQKSLFDSDVQSYQTKGYSYDEAYTMTSKNVAIPGQSEHACGLAADILSDECPNLSEKFEDTEAFAWLSEHAVQYGFILRYAKDKTAVTGINYEPWHYRFVGTYHAQKIKDSGLCLEEYMESLE